MIKVKFTSSEGSGSFDSGSQYTITYKVVKTDGLLGPDAAIAAVNWRYGDAYNNTFEGESNPLAYCVSVQAGPPDQDGCERDVSVSFRQFTAEEKEKSENPFGYEKLSIGVQQDGELSLDRDSNNAPIVNTAGDKIAGVTEPKYTGVFKITKNFATPPLQLLYLVGKVNGDSFKGFPPRTLKLISFDDITPEPHPTAGTIYPVTIHFAFEPEGFKRQFLNEGYRQKNDEGKLEYIQVNGEPTTEPMLLTREGKLAPEGSQPVWLDFETAYAVPFGGMI